MTIEEFRIKWDRYLSSPSARGVERELAIPEVLSYLDKEFTEAVKRNPEFQFSQVKLKFDYPRIYSDSGRNIEWEHEIAVILDNGNEHPVL